MTGKITLSPRVRVIHYLRKAVVDGLLTPGDPLPTELELCRLLEVSRTTVRAALQSLEKEQFLTCESRRRIVSATAPQRNLPAALFAETVAVLDDECYPEDESSRWGEWEILFALNRAIAQQSYHVFNFKTMGFSAIKARQLLENRPLGLVLLHQRREFSPAIRQLLAGGGKKCIPIVRYGTGIDNSAGVDTVASDHRQGCAMLARELIRRGCKRIVRFWRIRAQDGTTVRPQWLHQRDLGYEDAMREAGLEIFSPIEFYEAELEEQNSAIDFEHKMFEAVGRIHQWIASHGKPDAILCASDGVSYSVSAACRQLGLEPCRDILIAGYDNNYDNSPDRLFEQTRPFVTVDKHNYLLGKTLLETLLRRKNGVLPPAPQTILLPPQLILLNH